MNRTILILRNADRNYDRLFAAIDAATIIGGKAQSLSERQTARGYEVTLSYLPDAVRDMVGDRPKDFELI